MDNEYDYLFDILVIGDPNVGKSELISSFHRTQYNDLHNESIEYIEIGVHIKCYGITLEMNGRTIKLRIWDTYRGQGWDNSMTDRICDIVHGVIIVYDVTDEQSYSNIEPIWMQEIDDKYDNFPIMMLIGNKSDLPNKSVDSATANDLASCMDFLFYETSAINDIDVNAAFLDIVAEIKERFHAHLLIDANQ
jgi:Ras-related protein Rab-1A